MNACIVSRAANPRLITVRGPDHWASYLVNGDPSSLSPQDKAQANAWLKREGVRILDIARDANGEPIAPRFTWSYALQAPIPALRAAASSTTSRKCCHKPASHDPNARP